MQLREKDWRCEEVLFHCHIKFAIISCYIILYYITLSKEVGKQYFRVTNDFYLMELTVMKGGARVRL